MPLLPAASAAAAQSSSYPSTIRHCRSTHPQTADAVELLRLGAFFSNAALVAQLCAWLGGQMAGLPEETVLEVRSLARLLACCGQAAR